MFHVLYEVFQTDTAVQGLIPPVYLLCTLTAC